MSVNSTVNTNVSAPTDINANRGNYPNGVYALDMKTAAGGADADQSFALADGDETIGAYVGTIDAWTAGQGIVQIIELNFTRMNSAWNHKDYDIHVSLVSATDATGGPGVAGNNVGIASASFTLAAVGAINGKITIRREACQLNTPGDQGLLGCVMLVQVRKRGVTKKNDA